MFSRAGGRVKETEGEQGTRAKQEAFDRATRSCAVVIEAAAAEEMDPDAVAKAFVDHYYQTFDTNRAALGGLYQDSSMLTFEGAKTQGAQAIVAKLTGLPFQHCAHHVSTIDCQPSGPYGSMLVFVSGSLQLPGEQHALKFSQMFQLMPVQQGGFYVLNDIFRLNYA